MLGITEKILCGCGCGVGIVEKVDTQDGGCVLRFRKRQHGLNHFVEIPLPKGTTFDTLEIRPVN